MKRILLASSALVMSAGFAAAEVTTGGDGRMGVKSVDGGDIEFSSRIRISFSASGETDNGLTFGGSIRADNSGGGAAGTGGSVNIAGAFGTVTFGDTDSAAKKAVGQAGGVGYTGLGDLNEVTTYIGGADDPTARWDYTMGDLSLHASADNPGPEGDQAVSGALSYSIGDVGFGVGVETRGDDQNVVAGVTAALGDASVKIVLATDDDDEEYSASASFVSGSATFTAFASGRGDGDHFGIGASFDLGGNAKVVGGFVDGDSLSDSSFDLGVTLGF